MPVIEALIEVNTASKNWNALDGNYELLLKLLKQNLGPVDPKLLPYLNNYGQWKMFAYQNHVLKEHPSGLLDDLANMYQSYIAVLENMYADNDPILLQPLQALVQVHYRHVQLVFNIPFEEFNGTGNPTYVDIICARRSDPVRCIRPNLQYLYFFLQAPPAGRGAGNYPENGTGTLPGYPDVRQ